MLARHAARPQPVPFHFYRFAMYNSTSMRLCCHVKPVSVVVLLCTLSVFLFSSPVGPYTTVHGPVTALRARHASIALFWSIVVAALNLVFRLPLSFAIWACSPLDLELAALASRHPNPVLRC